MAHSDDPSIKAEPKQPITGLIAGSGSREPVSRALTMVFTDLQGSTSLKELMGDDRASTLIQRHCKLVLKICEAEQGHVVNNPGDGFFLVFEKPSQAVRFALRIQYAHSEDPDLPGVRIGIHHGEVNVCEGLGGFLGIEVDTAARRADGATRPNFGLLLGVQERQSPRPAHRKRDPRAVGMVRRVFIEGRGRSRDSRRGGV